MIGGLLTIYMACWFYQATIKYQVKRNLLWVVIGSATFFIVQWGWIWLDSVFFLSGVDDTMTTSETGKTLTSRLASTYRELMPILVGFLSAALVRNIFVLRTGIKFSTLFSDMNIFSGSNKDEQSAAGDDKGSEN